MADLPIDVVRDMGADVVLTPEVAGRRALDFSDARGIVAEGAAEARRQAGRLEVLALSEEGRRQITLSIGPSFSSRPR